MNPSKRPSFSARTNSSPVTSGVAKSRLLLDPLTPPASPNRTRSSMELRDANTLEPLRLSFEAQRLDLYTDDGVLICPFEVEATTDSSDRKRIFGYGAWSTVFEGSARSIGSKRSGLLTPPISPTSLPPMVVAIKKPARKDALSIIRHEAKILTHLRSADPAEQYVTTFHGILEDDSSLVLSAHSLTLEDHIKSCARLAQQNFTTSSMSIPIIGSTSTWLDLALTLVSTLDWLHNSALVVHGDIKPGNILLRPTPTGQEGFPYTPLLIDFSSSQQLDQTQITPNTLSAVTREYTAPELLSVAVLKNPDSHATPACDVFSLAVTLLVCATGHLQVYPNCSLLQRSMLATQGWQVIDTVRGLSEFGPAKLPRHGVVVRALERAVLKKDLGRISTARWRELLEDISMDMERGPNRLQVVSRDLQTA